VLDTGYAGLERDGSGHATVELSAADGARRVSLWMDDTFPYLMLFTGDSLPEADRRRTGLGVEPMTCAPNAFQSGEGLRALEPGDTFRGSWGIRAELSGG
jgi:aldose 1-epimerase